KGKGRANDIEITGSSGFQATYSSDSDDPDGPIIKIEPGEPDPVLAPPGSRRKGKEKEGAGGIIKPRTLSGSAAEMPVHQTQDEVDEYERLQRDLALILDELGTPAAPRDDADADGDAAMEEGTGATKRDAKTYLFQFPPVLPDLHPVVVKPDPDGPAAHPNGGDEAMDLDGNTASRPMTVGPDGDDT
ncbi:hypothetical protein LTR53_018787, partial [Teratosphaeriaceae sp. CCFEE 6253]